MAQHQCSQQNIYAVVAINNTNTTDNVFTSIGFFRCLQHYNTNIPADTVLKVSIAHTAGGRTFLALQCQMTINNVVRNVANIDGPTSNYLIDALALVPHVRYSDVTALASDQVPGVLNVHAPDAAIEAQVVQALQQCLQTNPQAAARLIIQ